MTTLLQTKAPAPSVYLPNDLRPSLMGLSREDLAQILGRVGVPEKQRRMRMRQIWHWIYHRGATSFAEMTDISQNLRVVLEDAFSIGRPDVVTEQKSSDGTRKWLLKLAPDERGQRHEVEMVYIPEEDRGTLVHFKPGGLHADLHLLPYGHAEAGAQSDGQ